MNYWHSITGIVLIVVAYLLSSIGNYSHMGSIILSTSAAIGKGDIFAVLFVLFTFGLLGYWIVMAIRGAKK